MWDYIAGLKQGRLVVLTTHSMEEADALGDKIAIIGSGTLQCVGSALHLKQRYGSGYRLTVMTEEFRCPTVIAEVKRIMPGMRCCCNIDVVCINLIQVD
jgi:ABC-type multidrug transport system ATPase subunit